MEKSTAVIENGTDLTSLVDKIEKTNNKSTILQNALHLFYCKGYDAVGVQEIVDSAKISKPTLYYYFKSKLGLLQNLVESKCRVFNDSLWRAADFHGDLVFTLTEVARTYLSLAAHDKEFFFLMIHLYYAPCNNESHLTVQPYISEQFNTIKSIFDKAEYQLGNMHGRQEQFTVGFMGVLTQYVIYHYERGGDSNYLLNGGVVYSIVHQFMHGIYS
ncbi:transcriptional regulator, TetR family [Lachnospiraceae bacterium KM106-2]|nr:transcriptional regulator, TetR family [Lachnospiraceae bacterium KM106-2]